MQKLTRIQYNSLSNFVHKFTIIIDQLRTLDSNFSESTGLLLFRALFPRSGQTFCCQLGSLSTYTDTDEYISDLINKIPPHIYTKKTRKQSESPGK